MKCPVCRPRSEQAPRYEDWDSRHKGMPRRRCVLCNKYEPGAFSRCYPGRVRAIVAAAYRLGGLEACLELLDADNARNDCAAWTRIAKYLDRKRVQS